MSPPFFFIKDWKAGYNGEVIVEIPLLDLNEGSTTVILGKSGSGKTTLLRSFAGLLPPISGKMVYRGIDPNSLKIWQRKRFYHSFGYVFQEGALLDSLTVWENLILPLKRRGVPRKMWKEMVLELLKAVALEAEVLEKFPAELSGGMKRRVGFARALALKPEVLFFDEPTMGLDPVTSKRIIELIQNLIRSLRLTFICTHDLKIPDSVGNLVLLLEKGNVIARVEREQWDRLRQKGKAENHSEEVILRFIAGLPPI
ncbi:MAG: ABC transporter ATP-binding protein [bacterium JZ-2024 1]